MLESTRARLLVLGLNFGASNFAAAVMSLGYRYLTYQLTGDRNRLRAGPDRMPSCQHRRTARCALRLDIEVQ